MILKDYLKAVYDLERAKYEQNRLVNNLENRLRNAEHPELISMVDERFFDSGWSLFGTILTVIISLLLSPIVGFILGVIMMFVWFFIVNLPCMLLDLFFDNSVITFLKNSGSTKGFLNFFTIAVPVIVIAFWLLMLITIVTGIKKDKSFNADARIKNSKTTASSKVKADYIQSLITKEKTILAQTQSVLTQYYNRGIIHPKYRNLVAVATFYEYIDTGRCSKLEGHEGAINLFESELRWERAFNKLDDIIYRLDNLQSGQQMLAKAIENSNDKIDKIGHSLTASLERINDNMETITTNQQISSFFGAVTAINTSYLVKLQNDRR